MSSAPQRPLLRYHGAKWRLAPWLMTLFPPHRIYVEPFGGSGAVLLRKPRVEGEVYNDLDGEVVNLFRVLRSPSSARALKRAIELTPWSRVEWEEAFLPTTESIERARRLLVRAWMSHGTTWQRANRTGFRSKMYIKRNNDAGAWAQWPEQIGAFVERLRGVGIENRPAAEVIEQHDSPDTLFYVDPPYVQSTRTAIAAGGGNESRAYAHELSDEDHAELAEQLHAVEGMVIVSGYESELYDELYGDWFRTSRNTFADGGAERCEIAWVSPLARARADQIHLFDEALTE